MHSLNEIIKAVDSLPPADRQKVSEHLAKQEIGSVDPIIERLRAAGIRVNVPIPDPRPRKRLPPLKIPGEPVSAQIIRERR